MLDCIDMLCYLIHASVAFNLGHELKLFNICLKWIEKIQVGLLVALIELSGRLT